MTALTSMTDQKRISEIADQIAYSVISHDDALYVKRNEFKLGKIAKADAYLNQGWTLCLSRLSDVIGEGETSEDGIAEATKVNEWMNAQN